MAADSEQERPGLPIWGGLAVPAGVLWGALLGVAAGMAFGNLMIGAAIGLGLGVGLGIVIFAAALVKASKHL